MPNLAALDYTPTQLITIRNTVAADANDVEFNLFIQAARNYGLDPFRKQIFCLIFNKNKPDRRKQAIIVGRDGMRSIAQRCGDYRPASEKAEFEIEENLAGPTNPAGLVSVTVKLWKQDNRGEWWPVVGTAYWDEFAPVKEIWDYNEETGTRGPSGKFELDKSGNWAKMPKLMLQKCAEAQALRAGWPDQFGGLYDEAETDVMRMKDVTPTEEIYQEQMHRREQAIGGKGILMTFDASGVFERVPMGKVVDRCAEFVKETDAETVYRWSIQNREPLKEFWAHNASDALELKKIIEAKTASLAA